MEEKIRHLEMVQGIINRMAGNSFFLKGWMVTLVTAFFSLSDKDENTIYFLLVYIPIFIFWMLDAYYLRQERLYRNLYDLIRNIHPSKIDFSMDASIPLLYTKKQDTYHVSFQVSKLLSIHQLLFYLLLSFIL